MNEYYFSNLPENLDKEAFEDIVNNDRIRIELILSIGHSSPEQGWYQQNENEWVIVLSGSGTLLLDNGDEMTMGPGDYQLIPAQ